MKFIRTTLTRSVTYFVAALGLIFTASAMAQYIWLDASGRKVFSDQPPPANIPTKRILQQPGKAAASLPEATEQEPDNADKPKAKNSDSKADEAKKPEPKDKELEAKKKAVDDAEAAKKKAEQDKRDAAKADNCVRAKQSKATLDSGVRLGHINAKGERSIMDDATRMVESKRLEGIIASDCK